MLKTKNQISSFRLFRPPLLLFLALLVFSIAFTYSLTLGFGSFIFWVSAFVLSTLSLLKFTKKKWNLDENYVKNEDLINDEMGLFHGKLQPEIEITGKDLPDLQLNPETRDSVPSEAVELSWISCEDANQSPISSKESIFDDDEDEEEEDDDDDDDEEDDDDENLIEIDLPMQSNCLKEDLKGMSQQNMSDLLPDSIFQQQTLMEFLTEINEMHEEENLIEIDVSMGCIRCSKPEIEM